VPEDAELDARAMSIQRLGDGARHRVFNASVPELVCTEWDGWLVQGPRTMLWRMRFIAEHDLHPLAHHTLFKAVGRLSGTDPGVADHEACVRIFEYAVCFDQLQVAEISALEVVVRRAQLVELKYRERALANDSHSTGGRGEQLLDDDEFLYLGTGRAHGLLMISPDLEEHVAQQLSKETATAKERRKMREERQLLQGSSPTAEVSPKTPSKGAAKK